MTGKLTPRKTLAVALLAAGIVSGIGFLALASDSAENSGGLTAWGANNFGQTGRGNAEYQAIDPVRTEVRMGSAAEIASGLNHSLALNQDGKVWGWGSNRFGQIGRPLSDKFKSTPAEITGLPKIRAIAAGQDHSMALDETGQVWTWGLNMSGQLGDGTNTDRHTPERVSGLENVRSIAAGYRMGLAIKSDGSLWAWGADCDPDGTRGEAFRAMVEKLAEDGEYATPSTANAKTGRYIALSPEEDCINEEVVGIRSVRPIRIEGVPALESISAGFGHMLAIDTAGGVWAWGCNTYGQVGNGTVGRGSGANLRPARVRGMEDAREVSAGFRHSMVLKRDGSLWAWGHDYTGALGLGSTADQRPKPSRVSSLPKLKTISAGHDYSLAIDTSGKVWGWGDGGAWQLSDTPESVSAPRPIWKLAGISRVDAGGGHVLAIRSGGL